MRPEQLELGADPGPSPAPEPPARPPTTEQRAAIEARDRDVLLEAGAGTGKTRVLVERYCEAAEESETGVDSILAFTFTERAAGELRHRIRDELRTRSERATADGEDERADRLRELARDTERAWISTIHGFCRRVLAAHPVALGLDPRFRVLDAAEADRVAAEAFDGALEELLEDSDPERANLVAAMRVGELRRLVLTAYAELRSQGREPRLPDPPQPDPVGAVRALIDAAKRACAETEGGAGHKARERLASAAALNPERGLPTEAELAGLELSSAARAFGGSACADYRQAWRRALTALVESGAGTSFRHIAKLVELFDAHYRRLKRDRSGLDFEDLQLEARRLLGEHAGVAEAYRDRFRHILVDEFQDTNRLQLELVRLLRGPETRTFMVGDEFQSVYGFRHADIEVFRGERDRIAALPDRQGEVMPLSGNFRSTEQVVAAVNALGGAILDGFTPLTVGRDDQAAKPGAAAPVELLLTPAGREWKDEELDIHLSGDYPSGPDRVAEARFLADRLRRLVADEDVEAGDIVVLI
ncbi:MAG: UvrD-helicase domain-containing protein, partial [Solirubrobacterales bacterium]